VAHFHITRPEIVHEIAEATKQNSSRNFQQNNSGWNSGRQLVAAREHAVSGN
jgi:hypothetical protein